MASRTVGSALTASIKHTGPIKYSIGWQLVRQTIRILLAWRSMQLSHMDQTMLALSGVITGTEVALSLLVVTRCSLIRRPFTSAIIAFGQDSYTVIGIRFQCDFDKPWSHTSQVSIPWPVFDNFTIIVVTYLLAYGLRPNSRQTCWVF